MKISIVIPTLNEAENLPTVLESIPKNIAEILIVDGYSTDNTVEIARKYNCKVIFDNKGKGSAVRKGMKEAKGDIVITMDADCSNVSSELCLLIAGIEAGFDICMGSRYIQGGGSEDITLIRKVGNKFFVFLVNLLWNMHYSDINYGYRSFRKDCIEKLNLESDGFGIESEISIKAAKKKLKVLEIPSYEKQRKSGSGKLRTFRDGLRILNTIIKEVFS